MKRFLTLFLVLLCAWVASGGPLDSMLPIKGAAGGGAKFPLTPPLTVSPSSAEIATPGYSFSLVATSPSSGAISYSSSDPTIATVNGAGLVTIGITTGSTDITVTQAAVSSYFAAAQVVVPVVASWLYEPWDINDVAVYFDGSDDRASASAGIEGGEYAFPATASARTVMFWAADLATSSGRGMMFFAGKNESVARGQFISLNGSAVEPAWAYSVYSYPYTRTTEWTHFCWSYDTDQKTSESKFYVNGTALTGGSSTDNAANTIVTGQSIVCGTSPAAGEGKKFKIKELAIWNRALSETEVNCYKNLRLRGKEPGLIRLYHFDENSGTAIADACGSGYNMTLLGGATWTTKL